MSCSLETGAQSLSAFWHCFDIFKLSLFLWEANRPSRKNGKNPLFVRNLWQTFAPNRAIFGHFFKLNLVTSKMYMATYKAVWAKASFQTPKRKVNTTSYLIRECNNEGDNNDDNDDYLTSLTTTATTTRAMTTQTTTTTSTTTTLQHQWQLRPDPIN